MRRKGYLSHRQTAKFGVREVGLGFVAWNSIWRVTRAKVRLGLGLG